MFNILMMAFIAILLLAKHGRRRRYLRGAIDHKLNLGSTLAPQTVIGSAIADVLVEEAWLSSVKATWSMDLFTTASNRGPIVVGVAHSDYTDTEIEEWIENLNSWETKDKIGQEIARRKIRMVGTFFNPPDAAGAVALLSEGRMVRTKCGWMLGTGQTLKIWGYNSGSGALATTDPAVRVQGHANLWPK